MPKIDISSTILERSLDTAKSFIDKLIMPSIEETGLLIKDKVALWRFNNQVKILNKAKIVCEKNSIDIKTISLKILYPYLDYAGLENDETLQDRWALLLSNMIDSKQNIENHVFPYLLSQISTKEFLNIEENVKKKNERRHRLQEKLAIHDQKNMDERKLIQHKINELHLNLETRKKNNLVSLDNYKNLYPIQNEIHLLDKELKNIENTRQNILLELYEPEYLEDDLEEYEIHNLIRLGIIRIVTQQNAYIKNPEIKNQPFNDYLNLENLEIIVETESEKYILTELGNLFIKACSREVKN